MTDSKLSPPFSGKTDGQVWAVIAAAGGGVRMEEISGGMPKQFLDLSGRPILARTLDLFEGLELFDGVVAVLPSKGFDRWRDLVAGYGHRCLRRLVPGGEYRFESVAAGLEACPDDTGVVAVHDGARPLAAVETIRKSVEVARSGRGAIAAVASQDTVKRRLDGRLETLDRSRIYLVQTPQTFPCRDLRAAYAHLADEGESFGDDAQLFERLGWPLEIVAGGPENIKLTAPADLRLAEAIIRSRDENRIRD